MKTIVRRRHRAPRQWAWCQDCKWAKQSRGTYGASRSARHHCRVTGHTIETLTIESQVIHRDDL